MGTAPSTYTETAGHSGELPELKASGAESAAPTGGSESPEPGASGAKGGAAGEGLGKGPASGYPDLKEGPTKQWAWDVAAISAAEEKKIADCAVTIEEAFLLRGSEEGKQVSQDLMKRTGFILEYSLLNVEASATATLEQEIAALGLSADWARATLVAEKVRKRPPVPGGAGPNSDTKLDHILALSMYTSTACCGLVNEALRASSKSIAKYVNLVASFVQGFRALPSYWGTVYRGVALHPDELGVYAPGSLVLMQGFTSASRSPDVAKRFAASAKGPHDGPQIMCLFAINSRSGRSLEGLSLYPDEQEVTFRPFTTFRVTSMAREGATCQIGLDEAHPDIRGRKVLVWVDDMHATESKRIMDHCEQGGVTCVHLHSTAGAGDFFRQYPFLLKRDGAGMRVITDMVRTEKAGEQNIEAGLDVVRLLADLGYRRPIMCFTGRTFLEKNQEKFRAQGFTHVFATADPRKAALFARFVPYPDA
jgi:hypothetical protein